MYILLWYNKTCGHTLERKKWVHFQFNLSTYINIYLVYYDVPKWTTIRSKCAFKLLHVCTRWIRVRVYHNNGFFLRKKTILPPTKERNKSRYTEKKQICRIHHYDSGMLNIIQSSYLFASNSARTTRWWVWWLKTETCIIYRIAVSHN